jgi:hypothetical protein
LQQVTFDPFEYRSFSVSVNLRQSEAEYEHVEVQKYEQIDHRAHLHSYHLATLFFGSSDPRGSLNIGIKLSNVPFPNKEIAPTYFREDNYEHYERDYSDEKH